MAPGSIPLPPGYVHPPFRPAKLFIEKEIIELYDLSHIMFKSNSEITTTTIMRGNTYVVGDNITESEYRWLIAIIDNEADNPEEWLALATTIFNNYEGYNNETIWDCIFDQVHKHVDGRTMGANYRYSADERRIHIENFRDGIDTFLVHADRYDEIKAILDWTMAGNRIFPPEVKHWSMLHGGGNAFSTDWRG